MIRLEDMRELEKTLNCEENPSAGLEASLWYAFLSSFQQYKEFLELKAKNSESLAMLEKLACTETGMVPTKDFVRNYFATNNLEITEERIIAMSQMLDALKDKIVAEIDKGEKNEK